MKQSALLKFSIFIIFLFLYLYIFDPSTDLFLTAVQRIVKLKLNFKDIFISIVWLAGFLGIITYSNLKNKKIRITFWALFFITYSFNIAWRNIYEQNFNLTNIGNFSNFFSNLEKVNIAKFMVSIVFIAGFILISNFLQPVTIDSNKYFLSILLLAVISTVIIYRESKILPMQIIYTTPCILIYGVGLKLFSWIKLNLNISFK